jgi:hypothetical protein
LPPAVPLPTQPLPPVELPSPRAIERELPQAPDLPAAAPLPTQPLPRVERAPVRPLDAAPSLLPAPAPPRGSGDGEPAPKLFAPPLIEPAPPPRDAAGFDFERAREVAREFNRGGGRLAGRTVDLEPPAGERVTPLGRAIQNAAQPDCREAYAALGLLGLIPLIADTVLDRGCRW